MSEPPSGNAEPTVVPVEPTETSTDPAESPDPKPTTESSDVPETAQPTVEASKADAPEPKADAPEPNAAAISAAPAVVAEPKADPVEKNIDELLVALKLDYPFDLDDERTEMLVKLRDVQAKHAKIEEEYEKEVLLLQSKYNLRYAPLYEERHVLLKSVPGGDRPEKERKNGTPSVPNFWLRALCANRTLEKLISDEDKKPLEYLSDIRMEWISPDDQLDFKIIFEFSENPYFENTELSTRFQLARGTDSLLGEKELQGTTGTTIEWKPGKDCTTKKSTRTLKHKKTGEKKTVVEETEEDSFFHFFKSNKIPNVDQVDKAALEKLEEEIETQVEAGYEMRDNIIPRAVNYFLGEVSDSDMDYDSDDDDADADYDEPHSSDDDDEDDDGGAKEQQGADGKQGDCKQQ